MPRTIIALLLAFQFATKPHMRPRPSFYPKASTPQHLQWVPMNLTVLREEIHWFFWKHLVPAEGRIFIEQKRAREGWCGPLDGESTCGGKDNLTVEGRYVSPIYIDPTLRNPTVLHIVLMQGHEEIGSAILEVQSGKIVSGEQITAQVILR